MDTTFAVRGRFLRDCPAEVLAALEAGRIHPLLFWLSTRAEIAWHTHSGALTARPIGAPEFHARRDVAGDEELYQELTQELGDAFDLRTTRDDLPVPFLLVPRRRAVRISVVIAGATDPARLLRCLHSIARQRTTAEVEVVLVHGPGAAPEAVAQKAESMFGAGGVRWVGVPPGPNDSAWMNTGVAAASGEVVTICRSDVVLTGDTVVEELAAWALQPEIATVGCGLTTPAGGGAVYGYRAAGMAGAPNAPILVGDADETYAATIRACAGNSRALFAIERAKLTRLGGFDETWCPTAQNDVELMLRASRSGLTHLYLGHLRARFDPDPSGENVDASLEIAHLRSTYPEALQAAELQMRAERGGARRSDGVTAIYRPEDLAALARSATAQTAQGDERRQRIVQSAAQVTEAANELAAAVGALQAAAVAD